MNPLTKLDNLDAAKQRFAVIVGESKPTPPAYRFGAQLGWLFTQADRNDMPPPEYVRLSNHEWDHCPTICLTFESLADLRAWASWAGEEVGEPAVVGDTFVYGFVGAINEVRVQCDYYTDDREAAS